MPGNCCRAFIFSARGFLRACLVMVRAVFVHEVLHSPLVATAIPVAIVHALALAHMGMLVFIAVVRVGVTMIFPVLAGAFHTIVESLALHITKFSRRLIPR